MSTSALGTAPTPSKPLQPVISTEAVSELDPVVPAYIDAAESAGFASSTPRRITLSRLKDVVLCAAPLIVADLVSLALCFLAATALMTVLTDWIVAWVFVYQFIAVASVYLLVGSIFSLFPAAGLSPPLELRQQVTAVVISFCALLVLDSVFGLLSRAEAVAVLSGGLLSAVVMPVNRFFLRGVLGKQSWWGERVVIVGSGRQGRRLASFLLRTPQRGLRPIGFVDAPDEYWAGVSEAVVEESGGHRTLTSGDDPAPYLGTPQELPKLIAEHRVGWAVVSIGSRSKSEVAEVLTHCGTVPNLIVLPSQAMLPSLWTRSRECGGVAGLHIRDALLQPVPRAVKRAADLLVASTALLLLSPLLLGLMLWVKVKSPGPAFYGHPRIGRGGRVFKTWKFRSMVQNADRVLQEHLDSDPALKAEWDADQKLKDDPRVIPGIGPILRKYSLDELPQLWNVLNGTMSVVGPRPIVRTEIQKYRELYPLYTRVRPGITGLWQISGRNNTSYADRVSLDSYYIRNWSPWMDAYIALRTVRTIVLKEGAY